MNLSEFFEVNSKVALAFSGGVDSAYLMYAAKTCNADVTAYYVKSQFQPQFELDDAKRLADELDVKMKIIELDVLSDSDVVKNTARRCYYCKRRIFSAICEAAINDGYSIVLDGTNASDDEGDRPGMRALKELSVKSPLRECGLTKDEIRNLSKKAGLFTWDKPAYACLATRVQTDEILTAEKLIKVEKSEDFMFSLGFSDFRVRTFDNIAKIQVTENQLAMLFERHNEINAELKKYFKTVMVDMECRK